MVQIPGTELWRTVEDKATGNNGRWENEQWGPLNNGRSEPCTTVFETKQELQVVFSYWHWFTSIWRKRASGNNTPTANNSGYTIKSQLIRILSQPNVRFSSLRLHSPWYSRIFPMGNPACSKHLQTLVDLDLDYLHFTMKELLYILLDTPHLQSIRIPSVTLAGAKRPLIRPLGPAETFGRRP
ncbi:MAG: hypothetical protein BYD32DRAFT_462951 [Podila humilis]|nr:MAG: hypothetical protein BYD32DRAFT_462951 [Podila humilis]